jgi:hypothetical protein
MVTSEAIPFGRSHVHLVRANIFNHRCDCVRTGPRFIG